MAHFIMPQRRFLNVGGVVAAGASDVSIPADGGTCRSLGGMAHFIMPQHVAVLFAAASANSLAGTGRGFAGVACAGYGVVMPQWYAIAAGTAGTIADRGTGDWGAAGYSTSRIMSQRFLHQMIAYCAYLVAGAGGFHRGGVNFFITKISTSSTSSAFICGPMICIVAPHKIHNYICGITINLVTINIIISLRKICICNHRQQRQQRSTKKHKQPFLVAGGHGVVNPL